jgi:hypothetical protein
LNSTISNSLQKAKQQEQLPKSLQGEIQPDYQKFEIYADMARANRTWEHYGHLTAPMAIKDRLTGTFIQEADNQIWTQNNDFMGVFSGSYCLFPNEEVDMLVNDMLKNRLADLHLSLNDTLVYNNGRTKYWKIVSDKEYKVTDLEDGTGPDTVRIGCVVRNGMGTGTALGIDLFTFRPICSNGAMHKGRDLGSMALRHVGKGAKKALEMKNFFEEGIRTVVDATKDLVKIYTKTPNIIVDNKTASQMYANLWWLGETYLPEIWNVKKLNDMKQLRKAGKLKNNDKLITVKKEVNLWNTFNMITQNQRDRLAENKIGLGGIAYQQNKLHQSLIQIVNQRKV